MIKFTATMKGCHDKGLRARGRRIEVAAKEYDDEKRTMTREHTLMREEQ